MSNNEEEEDENDLDSGASFVEDTDTEDTIPTVEVFNEPVSEDKLVPNFARSSPKPFSVAPKGQSRINILKGKRPRHVPLLVTISGVELTDRPTHQITKYETQWYEHALRSQQIEKIARTKNTLVLRIEDMHLKKILSLVDVFKVFQSSNTPIAITVPRELSSESLSAILQVEKDTDFISTISSSLDLQESMRKTILDVKNLPTCGCGYIYVHPSVTFAPNFADRNLLIGSQPGQTNLAITTKIQALEYLNALRFFLEIVFENLNQNQIKNN